MQNKVYSQQFFFDFHKTDAVKIKWKSGLNEFYIFHNDVLIDNVKGLSKMKSGVIITFPEAGNLYIRLVLKPIGFEVKMENRYLFNSRILSKEKLTAISQIFIVTGILTTFLNLNFPPINSVYDVLYYIPTIVGIFYIIAGILIKKGFLAFYIIGLILFSFTTLIMIFLLGWNGIVFHFLRISLLAIIIGHFKYILDLQKHNKAVRQLNKHSNDILDDF